PVESAVEFVTVGRKPVRSACVGNIWRVLAEVLERFSAPGEGSQVGRVSEIGGVCVDSARGQKLRSFTETMPLNGTSSRANAEVGAEINTAAKQASSSGIRSPAVGLN